MLSVQKGLTQQNLLYVIGDCYQLGSDMQNRLFFQLSEWSW